MFLFILFEILLIGSLAFVAKKNKTYCSYILAKICASIVLYALYVYHYQSGDIKTYLENLSLLEAGKPLSLSPQYESRAIFFIKVIYPIYKASLSNSILTSINLGLMNALAMLLLVKELRINELMGTSRLSEVLILFFPSVLFWTSGLTKETLTLSCVFMISFILLRWKRKNNHLILLTLPFISWLLFEIKYYQAIITIPFLLMCLVDLKFPKINLKLLLLSGIGLLALMSFLHPYTNPNMILEAIFETRKFNLVHSSNGIETSIIFDGSLKSFLINIPKGIYYGLISPLIPWNWTSLIAAAENYILMIASIYIVLKSLRTGITRMTILTLFFVLGYALLVGISSPYVGTITRLKTAYLPFLIILLSNSPVLNYKQNPTNHN